MSDDVRDLLSTEALHVLRGAFDPDVLGHAATARASSSYAPSAPFIEAIGARYYVSATSPVAPKDRERTLIGILAAGNRPAFALAIHIYWGLMEGLDVDDIADTLLLAGAYAGVDTFTNGAFTLQETLRLLAGIAEAGGAAAASGPVLGQLITRFRR